MHLLVAFERHNDGSYAASAWNEVMEKLDLATSYAKGFGASYRRRFLSTQSQRQEPAEATSWRPPDPDFFLVTIEHSYAGSE